MTAIITDNDITKTITPKKKQTRGRLMQTASELFSQKGYHQTSLQEITAICEIKKATFFHHFTSKQALAMELIENLHRHCAQIVFAAAYDDELDAEQRITQVAQAINDFFTEKTDSAMILFLGIELSHSEPTLRESVQAYNDLWVDAITRTTQNVSAQDSLNQLYGAWFVSRINADPAYFSQVFASLPKLWQA